MTRIEITITEHSPHHAAQRCFVSVEGNTNDPHLFVQATKAAMVAAGYATETAAQIQWTAE